MLPMNGGSMHFGSVIVFHIRRSVHSYFGFLIMIRKWIMNVGDSWFAKMRRWMFVKKIHCNIAGERIFDFWPRWDLMWHCFGTVATAETVTHPIHHDGLEWNRNRNTELLTHRARGVGWSIHDRRLSWMIKKEHQLKCRSAELIWHNFWIDESNCNRFVRFCGFDFGKIQTFRFILCMPFEDVK